MEDPPKVIPGAAPRGLWDLTPQELEEAIARDNAEREHIRLRLMAEDLESLAAVQPLLTAEPVTEEFPLSVQAWRFGAWLKHHLRKNPTPINTEAGPIYLTADYAETGPAEAEAWLDGWRSRPEARHEFSLPRVIRLSFFKTTPTLAQVTATYLRWAAEYYAGIRAAMPRQWFAASEADGGGERAKTDRKHGDSPPDAATSKQPTEGVGGSEGAKPARKHGRHGGTMDRVREASELVQAGTCKKTEACKRAGIDTRTYDRYNMDYTCPEDEADLD